MKNIVKVGLCIAGGIILLKTCKNIGYTQGVMDVLKQNEIDSFTKDYKNGFSITISKKKGDDK